MLVQLSGAGQIGSIDFNEVKKNVVHLLKDPSSLEVWSGDFFVIVYLKGKT